MQAKKPQLILLLMTSALAVEVNDRIFDNASEYESHHLDDNSTMEEIADYWDQTGAFVEEVEENEVND